MKAGEGKSGWILAILLMPLILIPIAYATATTVTIDSGVEFKSRPTGGIITFTPTLNPTTVEISSNFVNLHNPSTGYTVIGVDAPTGADIAVTSIAEWNLNYATTQAGSKTERFYFPNRPEPSIMGLATSAYDDPTDVLSVTTPGSVPIGITWHNSAVSYQVNQTAAILIYALPLIAIVSIITAAKHPDKLIEILVIIAVIAAFSILFLNWGF